MTAKKPQPFKEKEPALLRREAIGIVFQEFNFPDNIGTIDILKPGKVSEETFAPCRGGTDPLPEWIMTD